MTEWIGTEALGNALQFTPRRPGPVTIAPPVAPSDINLFGSSIDENSANGTAIGVAQQVGGTSCTFTLTDDAGGLFAITSGGSLTVAGALDHESAASHNVTIRATNGAGFFEKIFAITVNDVNEAASSFSIAGATISGGRIQIADNVSNGHVVGTISNNDPDDGDTQDWSLTDAMGGALSIDAVTGVVTVSNAAALVLGDDTFTVQAIDDGSIVTSAVFPVTVFVGVSNLRQFTLTNTNGAGTSTGFRRVGMAFEKTEVPSGQILQASIDGGANIRTAMLNVNTWSDGSLRSCTLAVDAGTFTASEVKTINVNAVVGSQAASSLNVSTYIASIDDLTVEITNHTGSADNVNVGNLTFSLQTAIATATRFEKTDDTDLCVRFWCWQKVAPDEHLTCLNYVDIWLDTDGSTVLGLEWTPVLSQHWYVNDPTGTVQTKQRRDYDATIKDGTTTLESHIGLEHGYYCRWAALRTANDDHHARRLWLNKSSSMPTLNLAYTAATKRAMSKTGYLPPLTTTVSIDATFAQTTHVPLGENPSASTGNSHNHRKDINGTGAYNGRGPIGNPESIALIQQTAAAWRAARVSAQAGLSVHYHIWDHRVASGGFADTDVSMGLIPFKVQQLGAQSYTGLAAETLASINAGSGNEIGDDLPVGGNGAFGFFDTSHHTSYSYAMAFIEGEAYLTDAVLAAAQYPLHDQPYNNLGTNPKVLFYEKTARRTALSLPATTYGAMNGFPIQTRAYAWLQYAMLRAYQLTSDSSRHKPYLAKLEENISTWLTDSLALFPASHVSKGGLYSRNGAQSNPWMTNFCVLASWDSVPIADDEGWAGFRTAALQCDKELANHYVHAPYWTLAYRMTWTLDDSDYLAFVPDDTPTLLVSASVTADVFTGSAVFVTLKVRDGDIIYPSPRDTGGLSVSAPAGLTLNQKYFVVNANPGADTYQLSLTQGGAAVTGIADTGTVWLGAFLADAATSPIGTGGADLGADDDYGQIAFAAAEIAAMRGSANFSASLTADIRTFYAPRKALWSGDSYAAWSLDTDF